MVSRRHFTLAMPAASMAMLAKPRPAGAQPAFPSRPIRIVVANAPGGTDDLISRRVADKMAGELRQPVVVENRGGGTTTIGAYSVVRSAPDGYTIFCMTSSAVVQTVLRKNLPYRLADFTPLVGAGGFPMALTLSARTNVHSVDDLRKLAQAGDGVTFASGGVGTMAHLTATRFLSELQGKGTHVSYRNNPEGLQALSGGYTQMMFPSVSEVVGLRKEGYVRVLAVTSPTRTSNLPDIPTMQELGFAGINTALWHGFMAPAGLPEPVTAFLSHAISQALRDQAFLEHFTPLGFQADIRSGDVLQQYLNGEAARWGKVISDNNIQVTD
ncbi:tripartite tricarboxylate transporter substrate binding protein [Roseomonas sp. GC11]|uniref:Bug family tripartite tricarboxylate transporter substrate binding protein n=1 Tax=Roseomonas sp. GC11 TaxID=2950546 RepID=UPI00210DDD8F|nr:tripartite tricarboxylate transporter substrate binding protein [Roseomonas sp. GC11]MCQ4159910.1 tripartite tricarboxylate transporter substrate binding protein [Roseomonas sp. GC11]